MGFRHNRRFDLPCPSERSLKFDSAHQGLDTEDKPAPAGPVYVEFGGKSDYSPRLFINSAAVTYVGLLTGEGGADVHLAGGERLSVHEDMKVVAA